MNDIKTNVYPENDYRYYLAHHGIKGMRWGVRRYQNEDGSLTDKGKKRYAKLNNKAVKEDNASGKPKYSESEKKRMMDNAVKKDAYNIDFLETVQNDIVLRNGGKELQKEYKKFLDNPDKYMETFKESDYQKRYRNTL